MVAVIDWYLHRKNCSSCAKSADWLEKQGLTPTEQVDARKVRYDVDQAGALIALCTSVLVARGKSWHAYDPCDGSQAEEMRKRMLGPHGTLRAPALRFGKVFVVGYNEEMYQAACRQV